MRAILLTALSLLLGACANYGSEKHFDRRPEAVAASKIATQAPDRATVYFYRQRAFMQEIVYIPIPPLYYAVDGKMLSIMPLGSHVKLSLEPGSHTFTRFAVGGGGLFPIETRRSDFVLQLSAGLTYYVGIRNGFPTQPFDAVASEKGSQVVADTELAQFIHAPVTVETFESRMVAAEAKRKGAATSSESQAPQGQESQTSIPDALPSTKQVGEFLEVVATVALVALLIFGVAAGSGNTYASAPPTLPNVPPAVRQPAAQPVPSATWRTSGATIQIEESKKERSVLNLSTGVRYRIEDGRISGTDGSRYRVVGSTVFSDSGQTYQVIGNNVFSSDGRSCVMTGVIVSCK